MKGNIESKKDRKGQRIRIRLERDREQEKRWNGKENQRKDERRQSQ